MKIIGEKLKIARQIRNMTITDLAKSVSKSVSISKQAISQFEKEESEPKTETLFLIAKALSFPLYFFVTPYKREITQENVFFRALRSTTELAKNNYIEKTKLLLNIYDYLSVYLDMPQLDLPKLDEKILSQNEYDEYNYDLITQAIRSAWSLGNRPIWNMVDLLEQHGIIMSVLKDESNKIDAFTFMDAIGNKKRFCVMLENEKNSMARRNFSIAHELGHIILHSNLHSDELESSMETQMEKQANRFAASFLLPAESFARDLKKPMDFQSYIYLKEKWHVSIKAMFSRAKDLGKISQEQYISLLKKYNYYISRINIDGEKLEPLDDEIPIDKPELFETALKILFEEKKFLDYRDFSDKLSKIGCGIDKNLIYQIMSLTDNFFDKYATAETIILKLKTITNEED